MTLEAELDKGWLAGVRVLIAEDDYLLASDTARLLRSAGARVVGPVATVAQAQDRLTSNVIDLAVLDIRLDGELVFDVADRLLRSGQPFFFLTGYDDEAIPTRFADVPRCQKPCSDEVLLDAIRRLHAENQS